MSINRKSIPELAHFWNGVRDVLGLDPLYQNGRSFDPNTHTDTHRFYRVYAESNFNGMKPKVGN